MDVKRTGVTRRVDDLGRILITKEFRRKMKIKEGDPLELCECDYEGQTGVMFVPCRPLQYNFPRQRILKSMYNALPNKDVIIALIDSGNNYLGPSAGHEVQADLVRKEGYSFFRKIQAREKPEYLDLENRNRFFAAPLINEQMDMVVAILLVCGSASAVSDNELYITSQAEILNALI